MSDATIFIWAKKVSLLLLICAVANCLFDITSFGAVPFQDNLETHFKNQKAFRDALIAANSSQIERVVRIPPKVFYSMPTRV